MQARGHKSNAGAAEMADVRLEGRPTLLAPRVRVPVDPKQAVFRRVRVDLGRGQRNVAEQFLDLEQIGSRVQQMGRERVSQRVGG